MKCINKKNYKKNFKNIKLINTNIIKNLEN